MTSRERVFRALDHQTPDRCPVDFWAEDATLSTLYRHFGVTTEDELLDIFNVDLQFVFPARRPGASRVTRHPDGSWTDESGSTYRRVQNGNCAYTEKIFYPLREMASIDEVRAFDKWPDADRFDWDHYADAIGDRHEKRVIKLFTGGLYENAWALRGQEQFLEDMILQPEIPHYIMDRLCDYQCSLIRHAMDAAGDKIDLVYTYDDIASQNGLIMSPAMLEEFVYPYHRKMNALIRGYGKRVLFHSCGAVFSQIGALKALPIDILNPLQPRAQGMDLALIKEKWGKELCFHGGIDIQETLPRGSREDVRRAVKDTIAALGKDGGYIMCSAHYIQNDTPVENIIAMYDTALR